MTVPRVVGADEDLGRRVFSKSQARRARCGRIRHYQFLPEGDGLTMSVDRLTVADGQGFDLTDLASKASASRSGPFEGWLSVTVADVRREGRRVEASPQEDNPYHADIVLPDGATDKGERIRHAQVLARGARWRERGRGPSGAAATASRSP